MEGKDDIFGGFSAISESLGGNSNEVDDLDNIKIPEGRQNFVNRHLDEEDEDEENKTVKPDETDETDDDDLTDAEKEAIELGKKSKTKASKTSKEKEVDEEDEDEDESEFGDAEPEMAEFIQEKIFDKFNLDIEDEAFDKFKSMDDVVNFVEEAIKVNSIPEFASDEVANIDQFVRDGGNLNDYLKSVYTGVDLETIDLDNEATQRAIVKQDLKNQGLSETRINKRIERMEDSGILREEAEDSKESLEEFKLLQEERLLEDQEKKNKSAEAANLKFVRDVESELQALDNVRGIPITKAEKNKLFNYMLKPTSNGVPQYHIDYRKNNKNMIESAFFTMLGDKLVDKVETKAKSSAAKKLKEKLADKGTRGRHQGNAGSNSSDIWSMISKKLG